MMKVRSVILLLATSLSLGAGQAPTTRPADLAPAATQRASTRPSELLEPVKEGTTQPATAPAAQFPDGLLLTDLVGGLMHEKNGEGVFVFEYKGKRLRMPILPNSYLARMEASASSNSSVRFKVTGRTTSYRGHNDILIQDAVVLDDVQ